MNGGNDFTPPYPLTHFIRFRRYIPIKIIASALVSCKNNAMKIFLWKDFNEKVNFIHLFNAGTFNICKRSQNSVFRNFRHSWAAFFV
ncbi:hypothetical protein EC570_00600 [Helicobacter pylori]|nr:hypothetical protein EC570_00600 [Helicobacter pylori]